MHLAHPWSIPGIVVGRPLGLQRAYCARQGDHTLVHCDLNPLAMHPGIGQDAGLDLVAEFGIGGRELMGRGPLR